jgi:hypothetical protein
MFVEVNVVCYLLFMTSCKCFAGSVGDHLQDCVVSQARTPHPNSYRCEKLVSCCDALATLPVGDSVKKLFRIRNALCS